MSDLSDLPLYTCHKQVKAAPITSVMAVRADASCALTIQVGTEERYVETMPGFAARSAPSVGDYLVAYDADYQSWSPKATFEDGYAAV